MWQHCTLTLTHTHIIAYTINTGVGDLHFLRGYLVFIFYQVHKSVHLKN
jgi:hypothetical protein